MIETEEIPTIDLKLTTVKVEPEVRKLRSNIKIVEGKPVFGIHKSCRKSLGINNMFQYWLWKRWMSKNWKNGR